MYYFGVVCVNIVGNELQIFFIITLWSESTKQKIANNDITSKNVNVTEFYCPPRAYFLNSRTCGISELVKLVTGSCTVERPHFYRLSCVTFGLSNAVT